MTKPTVGQAAYELLQVTPPERNPIELERAMHKDYEKQVLLCIETHKKLYPGSFYVVVLTKMERLMQNVLRHYFFARLSCPTPDYDQCVYYYDRDADYVSEVWVIPSQEASHHLKDNALYVAPAEQKLLSYVLDFADGTLFLQAKQRNGEQIDSPLLENR